MIEYALVKDNKVANLIVCNTEKDFEDLYRHFPVGMIDVGNWIKVSPEANRPGKGWTYVPQANNFYEPQPFPSWILGEDYLWHPPVPQPEGRVEWNEGTLSWIVFQNKPKTLDDIILEAKQSM